MPDAGVSRVDFRIVMSLSDRSDAMSSSIGDERAEIPARMRTVNNHVDTQWSDIDKGRLFTIGTFMYSGLTAILHPLTVVKIRSQTASLAESPAGASTSLSNIGQYYRGMPIVISLAVPARILYISTLEYTRECVSDNARYYVDHPPPLLAQYGREIRGLDPLITPAAGGIAGGLAAVVSQCVVVPMDVVSQKQMVMKSEDYKRNGGAMQVTRTILAQSGFRGLFKGFGLSLFTSLPTGTVWWATYAYTKDQLKGYADPDNPSVKSIPLVARQASVQVISAVASAIVSSSLTQPLDTVKTRLQVGKSTNVNMKLSSPTTIVRELATTKGLYKGLLPRIMHMSVWGSILSAAFEYLKLVSRKDYNQ